MTRASAPAASGAAFEFADGLGERSLQVDAATGETVEIFRVHPALTAVPSFEFALRERAARLANFRHPHFARVRRIDRIGERLAVVSDHVPGTRLASILRLAAERRIPVDTNAALCLIRQLVPAVALLHENARDVAHGAIAPERLIITPQARLVVAEYVLGSALERLQLTHDRLWRDYRVAMPPTAGVPRFDHRADVMQIGMTALALLLGRPLTDDEGPGRASAELVLSVTETTAAGARQPLSLPLRGWLARALQLDPRHSFATAAEAQAALEQVLAGHTRYLASTIAVEAFLSTCTDSVIEVAAGVPPAPVPPAAPPAKPASSGGPAIEPEPPASEPDDEAGVPVFDLGRVDGVEIDREVAQLDPEVRVEHPLRRRRARRWRRAAVVLLLLAGLAGGAFAGRRYLSGALAPAPGTLVVQSKPSGLAVFVDGRPFGPTPARIELAPGPHILELRGGDTPRVLPITVAPGATISHYVELASASRPASGQLDVRSEPAGARVFVDGQEAGVAPLLLANLSPGEHVVELQRDGATVRHVVTIEAGATSTLVAPVVAAPAGPASGWIAIRAPIAVQIYESGRLVGSSESERIMVPAGRRELEIVNTTLGFRTTRTVTVAPGATAVVSLALPNGVVHLNAIPWAEVWVDGRRVGETPIGNLSLPIGPHEIVFRHPVHGERRHAVSVTLAAPVRLSVDFTRP